MASPTEPGVTGDREFYVNQEGIVWSRECTSGLPEPPDPITGRPGCGSEEIMRDTIPGLGS
jgi:hypothetical protein